MFTFFLASALAAPPTGEELPDDEPIPELSKPETRAPSWRSGPYAAAELAVGMPVADWSVSGTVRAEGGWGLKQLEGRLRPNLSLAYTGPRASGAYNDGDLAVEYVLRDHQWILAPGVHVRLSPASAPSSAEISVAPQIIFAHVVERSTSGDAPVGLATESRVSPGVEAGIGVAQPAGPGEIAARAGVRIYGTRGTLTGKNVGGTLVLTVGYRYAL